MSDRGLLGRWVRATWAGWLLGLPIVIVLALAGEAVGIGGSQGIVGAGMGAGVGVVQGRVVRDLVRTRASWIVASTVGLALPFVATDVAAAAGKALPYSLYWSVALGGTLAGAWQALILRRRVRGAGSWILASALGWSLAAGTAALADALSGAQSLRGVPGAFAYLAILLSGGPILGLVTGAWLARLLRRGPGPGAALQPAP